MEQKEGNGLVGIMTGTTCTHLPHYTPEYGRLGLHYLELGRR